MSLAWVRPAAIAVSSTTLSNLAFLNSFIRLFAWRARPCGLSLYLAPEPFRGFLSVKPHPPKKLTGYR